MSVVSRGSSPSAPQGDSIPCDPACQEGKRTRRIGGWNPRRCFARAWGIAPSISFTRPPPQNWPLAYPLGQRRSCFSAPGPADQRHRERLTNRWRQRPTGRVVGKLIAPATAFEERPSGIDAIGRVCRIRRPRSRGSALNGPPFKVGPFASLRLPSGVFGGVHAPPVGLRDVGGVPLAPIVAFSPFRAGCSRGPRASDDSPICCSGFGSGIVSRKSF